MTDTKMKTASEKTTKNKTSAAKKSASKTSDKKSNAKSGKSTIKEAPRPKRMTKEEKAAFEREQARLAKEKEEQDRERKAIKDEIFLIASIAVAALGAGPNDLISDLNTMGFLFESLCVRDLRVFADALNGEVYHFREKNGLECDAVIHLRNGSYGLVEIKLGGEALIEEGANSLKALRNKIDPKKMKEPAFLMVLVGLGGFAYKREDSIYVVPIGCLKN